jgi:hypothetical protein
MAKIDDLARQLAEGRCAPPDDEDVEKACPFLWEILTNDRWGDGKERMLPTIRVERCSGGYKITLQDDSLCQQKRTFAPKWSEIPSAIERALLDPEKPWEPYRSYRNKQGPPVPEEKGARRRKR